MKLTGMAATALVVAAAAQAQEADLLLDTITVTSAARQARPLLDTPVAATVVEGEALAVRQATNFQELIGDQPGVLIAGGPRPIAQEPNIRGFSDDQIVMRYDGGRSNFNDAHRGRFFIDPEIIQRIEIIRGGGSTLYGSGALGGVIAVETKDVSDLLEPGRDLGGRLTAGWSSNGEIGQASATLFGRQGRFDALGFIGWQPMGADLEDGDGEKIRSSQIDIGNALVKFGFEPNEANRIELSGALYRDEGTTPPNANAAASATTDVDRDADVSMARLSWDYAPPGSTLVDLTALAYFNGLKITEDRDYDGRNDVTRYETWGIDVTNRSEFELGRPVTLVYGIEAFRDTQEGERNGAARLQYPEAEATTIAAYAEATIALSERLEIIPGIRWDNYDRDPNDPALDSVNENFFSPRLGISYRPNDAWQIYGNVARAFRAPSMIELYNDGVHFAIPGFPLGPGLSFSGVNSFVPNPDLEPERSTQVELGTRYSRQGVLRDGDSLDFAANAYYAEVKDFIDQTVSFMDFSTMTPGPGGMVVGGTTTTENVDARLWGFEATADYDAGPWFAGLILTLPRGEEQGGGALGSIPQDRLTVSGGLRPAFNWQLGARATFAAEEDDVPEGSLPADGWTTVDLFASWAPQMAALEGTVFRAGIDNVFDETYAIYPNGLNQPGRTFKMSAAVAF
ncbi:MAG TPA: TonB-dependent hemoglobin/transferrin/lactoferrin family receptor [Amaricoccus sp.]|nr:TonB-dependent hemoglobin/transferrin/lactoferrin family receptor [Amaricoccus sp.]